MRISIDVKGYYDWVKPPPGTVITQDDVDAGRARRAADDEYLMKIVVQEDTHHDVGIPDEAIERRMSELAALGGGGRPWMERSSDDPEWRQSEYDSPMDRDEVVAELLRASCKHHLHRSHMVKISVHDEPETEAYLNQVFKTARNARKGG